MIKDTLFAQYIKERLNQEVIENESGFIIYNINGKSCFLAEMYIKPDSRKSGLFIELLNELKELAVENDCEHITATIHQYDKGATNSLSSAFKYGFKIHQAHNNIITIILNLSGGI